VASVHGAEPWMLSPTDLTFLFECPRCFWLKVAGNLPRPRAPVPKVFSLLDTQTKDFFLPKRTEEIAPDLPPGRVLCGDRWVRSQPLTVPGHRRKIVIRGRADTALAFEDGTFGIIDFKTTEPKPDHVNLYGRQLHSYALAAENPARGGLALDRVSVIGLLCVEPLGVDRHIEEVAYYATAHWLGIPRDDDAFLAFLLRVLLLLDHTTPPEPAPKCQFCRYLAAGSIQLLTDLHGLP
jgi:hypothetical protein